MLALAACTPGELKGGPYRCTFNDGGGSSDQCPGDYRCGLEGYCHPRNDVSVAWKCFRDDLCERGYHCGADGLCYDRTVPAPIACRPAFEPDAGAGPSDCANGWRCGADRVCQDRDAGGPYSCRTDAGADDRWCERGWRCAPEGTCVNPADDALVPTVPLPLDAGLKINPLGPPARVDHFSVSPLYTVGRSNGIQTTALIREKQITALVSDRFGAGAPRARALGPSSDAVAIAAMGSRGEHPDPGNQARTSDEENRVFVIRPDGGIDLFTLGATDPVAPLPMDFADPYRRLSIGSAEGDLSPSVLAFNDIPNSYARMGGDYYFGDYSDFRHNLNGYLDDDPANRLRDLAVVRPFTDVECVFAVDHNGLWVSQRGSNGEAFDPISVGPNFTNFICAQTPSPHTITAITPYRRDWMAVASNAPDGGSAVSVLNLQGLWNRGSPYIFCALLLTNSACNETMPISLEFGPCPVCAGGALLDQSIGVDEAGKPVVHVRCGGPDGGTTGFATIAANSAGGCLRTVADGEAGVFGRSDLSTPDQGVGGNVSWASADGYIWSGRSPSEVTSRLFDRVATTVARTGPAIGQMVAFTPQISGVFVSDVGLETRRPSNVTSGVAGQPQWVLSGNRELLDLTGAASVDQARTLGVAGSSVTPFAPPFTAGAATTGLMQRVVVITASNSIFAGVVDASAGTPAALPLRVVSPSPISSIAFPTSAPAGAFLRGYVVTANGVLLATADSLSRWSLTPIALPAELVPLEVWFDGARGRVGFDNGEVYSLPSRVKLVNAFGGDSVVDYAQGCGQQFVLSTTGLFRLEPKAADAIGVWTSVPLPIGEGMAPFARGRLHALGSELYVFTHSGETARVSLPGCGSP